MLAVVIAAAGFPAIVYGQGLYNVLPVDHTAPAIQLTVVTPAQTVTVSINVKDSTVEYVINEIARQAHLRAVYDNTNPQFAKRITIHVTKASVTDALATALKGTNLVAKLAPDGETVMIRAQDAPPTIGHAHANGGTVNGAVTDSASGQPVTGASVSVQDTKVTTTTSGDGTFLLTNVPVGTQLVVVKAFGYKPFEESVTVEENARRTLRIVMRATATILSGVVTTATGIQSKMAVGSDITTINVDSVMKTAPIHTVTDLLENRVPGLTVVHTSGTPGDPSRLLLRGAASVYGSNNPIVVVDGVRVYYPDDNTSAVNNGGVQISTATGGSQQQIPRPSPLDQIDPNTIETIEVLKGPSASALYGSDAANGVIVITTKKGRPGQMNWSVTAQQGYSYIPGTYPVLTYDFGHTLSGALGQCTAGYTNQLYYVPASGNVACIVDSTRSFQALNESGLSPLTGGPLTSANATVSGGTQALTYSFTGSASNTHGLVKLPDYLAQQYQTVTGTAPLAWMKRPDDYTTVNGSSQLTVHLSPAANITVQNLLGSSTQHRSNYDLSAVGLLMGQYINTSNTLNAISRNQFSTQIIAQTNTATNTATLNWQVRPWLPLTVTAGLNQNRGTDHSYEPNGTPYSLGQQTTLDSGSYAIGLSNVSVKTLDANTTIPITLRAGPQLRLAVGTNLVDQSVSNYSLNTQYIPYGVNTPSTFIQDKTNVSQTAQSSATYGWFAEPQLILGSRLFVTPGFRFDGGTASGGNAGLAGFPKINASYVAVDQSGEHDGTSWSRLITLLRLRGAFGIAGIEPTPGQSLRLLSPEEISLDGGQTGSSGAVLATMGNTLLHPERSREIEMGFDMQFLQDRLMLTATYYNKLRIDAIEAIPLAPSVGSGSGLAQLTQYYDNVGTIRNTGLELSLQAWLLQSAPLSWSVNGSISTDKNRVLSTNAVAQLSCSSPTSLQCIRAGYPLDGYFAQPLTGYNDLNHDGVIETSEIQLGDSSVFVGAPDPNYTATLSTTMSFWHGTLSINANGDYQNGLTTNNRFAVVELVSALNQAGANATLLQQATTLAALRNPYMSYQAFQTVNTFRWDGLSINYVLPAGIAHAFRGNQAMLSLQGSNLWLVSNYQGKDPNINNITSGLGVQDAGQLPLPRTWIVAFRLTR